MERVTVVRRKKTTDERKIQISKDLNEPLETHEFIEGRLYFAVYRNKIIIDDTEDTHFFNTDDLLVYTNFFEDFGPLNLGKLYRFCRILYGKLKGDAADNKRIVYWTVLTDAKRANAAFLIGCFAVILLDMSPREAIAILNRTKYKYKPFNDANMGNIVGENTIRLHDCLSSINKAFYFNLVNFADFDLSEYEHYEGANPRSEGDLSWIVPQKLIAFAGPCGERNGNWPVELYIGYFQDCNVFTVIRLNKSLYDCKRFTLHGIDHFDLIFPDGTTPPDDILDDFLEIAEKSVGAIAIHCKAGLGRTGCLIGIFLMKHYRMTATEAIAWMRICRPGCVIGQQQKWLQAKQSWAWRQGDAHRERIYGSSEKVRQHKYGVYSVKGRTVKLRQPSEADRAGKFADVRERIRKRRQNFEAERETQGDLLLASRNSNMERLRR
ncbi:Hypothetical protein NTJ_00124 [Nesidiocoris tenuis]|uniref:protein-tyrosine-phosphatase n=1 Tax=Nesidiocoris tenuis TaxID=355587 RepID=A0ABN7A7V8_9HEMI|nr:Hypothetical protein NTJ_00124 [Nesidiocoris tenuis]